MIVNTDAKDANKWITGELFRLFNEESKAFNSEKIDYKDLSKIISLVNSEKITASSGKEILRKLFYSDLEIDMIIEDGNYMTDSQEIDIKNVVENILKDSPEEVKRFKNGEEKLLSYFIGKIMKASGGKVNYKKIVEALNKELEKN